MEEQRTAIALRYSPTDGESAPKITAKGDGYLAEEILRIARENDVPLRQDAALAGALASLDVGQQIPSELFRAVAEVLTFVYKMNKKA
jgi:flagellar biosynthesis protein